MCHLQITQEKVSRTVSPAQHRCEKEGWLISEGRNSSAHSREEKNEEKKDIYRDFVFLWDIFSNTIQEKGRKIKQKYFLTHGYIH